MPCTCSACWFIKKGDHATAIRFLNRALEPASAELYTNLGTALFAQGRVDAAISAFRDAVSSNPFYAVAHNNPGNALRAAGDFDAAAATFRQAIRIAPDYALAHFNPGDLLHAAGNRDEAIASTRHALALDPGLATAYSSLASLLMEKGDTDQARILFKQAIQHDRKNAVAKHMLAALEGQTTTTAPRDYVVGLFDGCADYFDRQLADDPGYRAPQQLYTAVTRQVCLCNQSYRAM
jgi:tetratricopeptide (TPR) repeat protein